MSEQSSREDVDQVFAAAYQELRRLAARVRGSDPAQTLTPTALVNEAYLKLAASKELKAASRMHFKRIAARAMRQVLVEASRKRSAAKRGSGQQLVTFDEGRQGTTARADEVIALDTALDDLAKSSPRQALLVECRFFGGLEAREIAQLLEVSESTIDRDWRAARAWLSLQIRRGTG